MGSDGFVKSNKMKRRMGNKCEDAGDKDGVKRPENSSTKKDCGVGSGDDVKSNTKNKCDENRRDGNKHNKNKHDENRRDRNKHDGNEHNGNKQDAAVCCKKYKRSDSKNKDKDRSATRSSPKIEYVLEDATQEEKALILDGTIVDRINCLSLLCARNPTVDNYKQLLYFVENQRNDVIYLVLKNLRDLLKDKAVEDPYIKGRIVKSFERGLKNQYIKEKVIEIAGVLIRAGIYAEDFISIVVERMGEKDNALKLVETVLKSIFLRHESFVMACLEDFYYKNDNFRIQYIILRFLGAVDLAKPGSTFDFYNQALTTLDSAYPADQRDLMLDLIINGLGRSTTSGSVIDCVDLIRTHVGTAKTAVSSLGLLHKINDPFLAAFALKTVRSLVLRRTKYECVFLNTVSEIGSPGLVAKLVNNCFYYPAEYIISVILLAHEHGVSPAELYGLMVLVRHYHPAVRDIAFRTLRREKVTPYDPYDRVALDGFTRLL